MELGDETQRLALEQVCSGSWSNSIRVGLQQGLSRPNDRVCRTSFSYTHTSHKGNAKWQRVIVLGKTESQDTYVVFTGRSVMLSRSVRRIATDWKNHLGFYIHFNAPTSLVSRLALVAESSQLAAQLKPYLLQAIRPLAKFSHQLFMMQMEKL